MTLLFALFHVGRSYAETSVLFIGNSFTYGYGSASRFYRADTVTDLNLNGIGGVPAL
ncbi:MAG: PEP-CTERM sorting domain-containing protein, partial [Gammaproteobacteria bacterium]|nr:PEP-CTERM sorting domain-containing protein [Gammaproteobacteria bacterium]